MQIKFFIVPVAGLAEAEAELNGFLRSHRVLSVRKDFVAGAAGAYWAVAVAYLDRGTSERRGASAAVDYREVLGEQDFAVYRRLRELRKPIADAEGLPAFAVFTNAQLAAMVQQRATTPGALGRIEGVGEAKVAKYAARFLPVLQEAFGEAGGPPVPADH